MLAVLALLAVVGLYVAGTFQDALFGATLATTRIHQQRAFELADFGIGHGLQRLSADGAVADFTEELRPLAGSEDGVTVALHATAGQSLPVGFSMRRLVARHYEITSTGHVARGVRCAQVQGVVRILPAAEPGA